MRKNKAFNYLDYIPRKSEFASSYTGDNGKFYVKMQNMGFYNKFTQVILGRPKHTTIELEQYGTFIWPLIDGQRSIYDIAMKVKGEFGEEAEPLYDRICKYFGIMADNKLIVLEKK